MPNPLTKYEWMIMEALWNNHPMALSDIMETLKLKLNWASTTYLTYLKRLVSAGYVKYETKHGNRMYEPIMTREDCAREESRSLMDRMTEESRGLFVLNMVKEGNLSASDTRELRNLIDTLTQGEKGEES